MEPLRTPDGRWSRSPRPYIFYAFVFVLSVSFADYFIPSKQTNFLGSGITSSLIQAATGFVMCSFFALLFLGGIRLRDRILNRRAAAARDKMP